MKKIISLFCILSILLTSTAVRAEKEWQFNEEVVNKLDALGVLEGVSDRISDNGIVMRADFAAMIAGLVGFEETKTVFSEDIFPDVSKDYWAAEYISYTKNLGIFVGYKDGKFYPNDPIEYDEAISVLVNMAGYSVLKNIPGYALNYREKADELGITAGITEEKPMTWEKVMGLINNSLEVEYLKIKVSGTGEISIPEDTDETLLSHWRDIRIARGIVKANSTTTLTSGKYGVCPEGMVNIGGMELSENGTSASELLGYNVEYYYYDDGDEGYTLKYIVPAKNKNTTTAIKAEDLIERGEKNKIYYYLGKGERSLKLSPDMAVIYNGVAKADYPNNIFYPKNGEIVAIDNNNDGTVDVVKVLNVTQVVVVGNIAKDDDGYIIVDKRDKSKTFSLELDNSLKINGVITSDGKASDIAQVTENDILLICENSDFKYYYIIADTTKISGTIGSVGNDEITIDGTEYDISEDYRNYEKLGNLKTLKSGMSGTFYIDRYNVLQYMEGTSGSSEESELKYAILLSCYEDENEECGGVKLFDQDGKTARYTIEDKIKFSGASYPTPKKIEYSEVIAELKKDNILDTGRMNAKNDPKDPKQSYLMQLVTFKYVGDKITELNAVSKSAKDEIDVNVPLSYAGGVENVQGQYVYYPYCLESTGYATLGGRYYVDRSTLFFRVTEDERSLTVKKGYFPEYTGLIGSSNGIIHVYNQDETKTAAVVIGYCRGSSGGMEFVESDYKKKVLLVTGVGSAIDDNDMEISTIKGFEAGKQVEIPYDKEEVSDAVAEALKNIKAGDIICYSINSAGVLCGLSTYLDSSRIGEYGNAADSKSLHDGFMLSAQHIPRNLYGVVKKVIGNYIIYDLKDGTGDYIVYLYNYSNPIYDAVKKNGKVKVEATKYLSDLKPGDEIFIRYDENIIVAVYRLDYQKP